MDRTPASDFDALVVGFGPCGAVAAGMLGGLGHRVLVVERNAGLYDKPRAIALDHEIFRHFDNMGLAGSVAPFVAPFTASQHFGADGGLIRVVDMAPPPHPLGYTPSMVFSQPPVEAALRAHAAAMPSVEVALGVELVDLIETNGRVEANLREADGQIRKVCARYALGCDGANSTVRRFAGLALDDLEFDEPWLVVDMLVREEALAKLPQTSAQFCDPARPASFIIGPGAHRRWEIMLLPGEDRRRMEAPDAVWGLLARWLQPRDGQLWRAASYRFHALVANAWRRGRLLIAGDAAHQQPPFFGQGMCQGLRDVTNLVWKLDRVLKGASDDGLLDTYAVERKRHVVELTTRIKTIGRSICLRDPEAARRRDAEALTEGGGVARKITRQEIVPPLREGFLALAEAPARGLLFPQPRVVVDGAKVLLDKATGAGWRLVLDGRRGAASAATRAAAARAGFVVAVVTPLGMEDAHSLEETDGVLAAWFDRYDAAAALVRPDHYVFGAVASSEAADTLVEEAAQRLRPAVSAGALA